jgi:phosphatidylglycerol:prolipoprotein diacylglycerol transferase
MFPILQLGPLALQVPGFVLLVSVWLGLSLAEKNAPQHQVNPAYLYNLSFAALIGGILGARLIYAARYPAAFIASPTGLFSLNPGLLDPWGGLAAALIVALVYGQRRKMPFWSTLDALTPGLALFLIGLALANLASGKGYGIPTELPWGIPLWGKLRHPTQVYEALAYTVILTAFWPQRGWLNATLPGHTCLRFLATSAGVRLFLEAWHGDSKAIIFGLRAAQVIAWLVLLAALIGLYRLSKPTQSSQALEHVP